MYIRVDLRLSLAESKYYFTAAYQRNIAGFSISNIDDEHKSDIIDGGNYFQLLPISNEN